MQVLLDTHALLWWLAGDPQLSAPAKAAIADPANEVFVSAVSAWEIATKFRLGRLPGAQAAAADVAAIIADQGFTALPITVPHGQLAGSLPSPHRDPFDRMLIAQSMLDRMPLVSIEPVFDRYGVHRIW